MWTFFDALSPADAVAATQRIETLGYSALWVPEAVGREPFALLGFLAGGFLGIPATLALPRRPGPAVQCAAGGAAAAALIYCWKLALG